MKKLPIVAIVSFGLGILATFAFNSVTKKSAYEKVQTKNVEVAAERDAVISLGSPIIEWDKTEHDFGTLNQGDKAETTFTLTNVGKGDLVITKAVGSCGCTIPDYPKEAVKPGESAGIKVIYNSTGKKNKTTNTVTLTTNTEKGNEIVRIKAFVNAPETPAK